MDVQDRDNNKGYTVPCVQAIPGFLKRFRVFLDPADDLPPWPGNLREWWTEAPDSPTETELIAFVHWAEKAAGALAGIEDEERAEKALEVFEFRCKIFDALPRKMRQNAIQTIGTRSARNEETALAENVGKVEYHKV